MANANVGLLIQNGADALGATVGVVGISGASAKEGARVLYAARYRRYVGSWGLAGDVQLGFAGGPTAEVAFGWGDLVAVTAGVNRYELEDGGHDILAGVGLRVGSVAIGGLFYLTALVVAGSL